jgi:hypothetical protein
LNTPAGSPARVQDVGDGPGAARHQVGGLEHHGVAEGQRRRDLPGGNRDREVPGRDQADHADRLARHFDADAGPHGGQHFAAGAQGLAGEELEDVAGTRDFADGLGQGLAFLARQQVTEFIAACQDLGTRGIEDVEALLRRGHAPGRLRLGGRGDRLLGVLGIRLRVFADHVTCVGRIDVAAGAGAFDPLAADQVLEHVCLRLMSSRA